MSKIIINERVSTKTAAGSAVSIPATYHFGEAIELRYTSALVDTQFQGIFLEVRSAIANSSTIRGMEIAAAQAAAVAIGVLEGANIRATVRSATTGDITSMYGVTGEANHNSAAYTGTITEIAAVRGKVSMEDGAIYTKSSVFLADVEPVSGADVIGSYFRAKSHANISATAAIDVADAVLVETDSGKEVTLIRFTGANGTVYRVVHDAPDAATVLAVVTD